MAFSLTIPDAVPVIRDAFQRNSHMKQKFVLALLSVVLVICLSGCCRPEIIGSVPNTLRPQETNNWCWAATTQMLAEYMGLSITQCALANHRFNKTNCCNEQTSGTLQLKNLNRPLR